MVNIFDAYLNDVRRRDLLSDAEQRRHAKELGEARLRLVHVMYNTLQAFLQNDGAGITAFLQETQREAEREEKTTTEHLLKKKARSKKRLAQQLEELLSKESPTTHSPEEMEQLLQKPYASLEAATLVESYASRSPSEATMPGLQEFQKAYKPYLRRRNVFAEANLPLVISWAKKYRRSGLEFTELIGEGNQGLLRAIETYDHRRKAFSTYASPWIRLYMQQAILREKGKLIHLPLYLLHLEGKVERAICTLQQLQGKVPTDAEIACKLSTDTLRRRLEREPTDEEIADEADLVLRQMAFLEDLPEQPVSLDAPRWGGEEKSVSLEKAVSGRQLDGSVQRNPEEQAEIWLYREIITTALDDLVARNEIRPKDKEIFLRSYAIGYPEQTLEAISEQLPSTHKSRPHMTKQGVQQLSDRVLRKVRRYLTKNRITDDFRVPSSLPPLK